MWAICPHVGHVPGDGDDHAGRHPGHRAVVTGRSERRRRPGPVHPVAEPPGDQTAGLGQGGGDLPGLGRPPAVGRRRRQQTPQPAPVPVRKFVLSV